MPSLASRRVVSLHASLGRWCRRPSSLRRVIAASSHLSRRCCLLRLLHHCLVVIAHRPTAFGWLLCLSPLPLAVAVSCVASRRLPSRVAPLPPCLTCRIVASHRAHLSHRCRLSRRVLSPRRLAVAISCVASLRLPPASLRWSRRRRRVALSPPCLTCPSLSS